MHFVIASYTLGISDLCYVLYIMESSLFLQPIGCRILKAPGLILPGLFGILIDAPVAPSIRQTCTKPKRRQGESSKRLKFSVSHTCSRTRGCETARIQAISRAPVAAFRGAARRGSGSARLFGIMDHNIGAHLHHTHVDSISFGIDQILNNAEQGSCMISNPRMQDLDYGLGSIVSNAYNTMTGNYNGNNTVGYNSNACNSAPLGVSYNMNVGMNGNGNGLNTSGVIRVPAHRPLNSMHSSIPTSGASMHNMAGMGTLNNITGLTFPWMESNRRYTKDRFTGNITWLIF